MVQTYIVVLVTASSAAERPASGSVVSPEYSAEYRLVAKAVAMLLWPARYGPTIAKHTHQADHDRYNRDESPATSQPAQPCYPPAAPRARTTEPASMTAAPPRPASSSIMDRAAHPAAS